MNDELLVSFAISVGMALVALVWYALRYSSHRSREGVASLVARWLSARGIATIALATCAVMAVSLVTGLVMQVALPEEFAAYTAYMDESAGYPLWYLVLSTCVFAPIGEELIFRGVVFGALRRAGLHVGVAIVIQAVLFGVLHGSLCQVVYGCIAGLLFGWICLKTNSVVPGIIIHVLNNVVSLALVGQSEIVNLAVVAICVAGTLVWVVLLLRGTLSLEPSSK